MHSLSEMCIREETLEYFYQFWFSAAFSAHVFRYYKKLLITRKKWTPVSPSPKKAYGGIIYGSDHLSAKVR